MTSIKFKSLERLLLIGIVLLGAFIYLYKLENNPPGLFLDEADTGYNVYSILRTGKDEYGMPFPAAFRMQSYTPPLYIYLSVPLMAIFGLSAFSTRLLSVICGIGDIFVIFFIIKALKITTNKFTPLVATLFFAITPWAIFFSRMGYEQNLALLFFSTSVLLIIKSLDKPKLLTLTIPIISLTTYTDYPQRLLAPILFLGASILFWKRFVIKKNIKYIIFGIVFAAIIQIPNLFMLSTPSFYTKTGHFYSETINSQAKKIENYLPAAVAVPLSFSREFFSQFFTYFSPRSLFFLPDDDPQRSIPGLSVFYPWMVIPYIIGLYFLWKKRKNPSSKIIFLLLLITPLPGALTKQPFHIQRTLTLLLPLTLILTLGYDRIMNLLPKKTLLPIISLTLILSLILFWRSYFILLPQERSEVWAFEWKPLALYIKDHPNDHFVIDQSTRIKPQEMAFVPLAFYLKLDPAILQNDQKKDILKNYYTDTQFSFVHKFLNIEAKPIEWGETVSKNEILVGDLVSISDLEVSRHTLTKVFEIKDPNNVVILRGFKTNPRNLVP